MAVLVAVGGAALGSAVGIGWSAGWLIGSIIGNLLFPAKGQTVEGSRLSDLSVTSSAYGAAIGVCYGTVRTAGNMIWSTGLEEVKTTKKQGGKGMGGGGQTTVTYSYYASFAIAFCEGVADRVLRMWADGKLIYDTTGSGEDITSVDLKFRFYQGSEHQNPDGLILADKGASLTPAFRGLCYIVFERLPLENFGNRIPSITAEITFDGESLHPVLRADFLTTGEGGLSSSFQTDEVFPDFDRSVFYTIGTGDRVIRRFNLRTMVEERQNQIGNDNFGEDISILGLLGVSKNGYLFANSTASNSRPIHLIDPNTLEIRSTFGYSSNALSTSPTHAEAIMNAFSASPYSGTGRVYMLFGSVFHTASLFDVSAGTVKYLWDSDTYGDITESRMLGVCAGAVGDTFCEAYYMVGPRYIGATSSPVRIKKLTIMDGAFYDYSSDTQVGVTDADSVILSPEDLIPGQTSLLNCKGLLYDETDDCLMLYAQAGVSPFTEYLIKVNPSSGEVVWRTVVPAIVNEQAGWNRSRISNGIYGYMVNERAYAVYTASGEMFYYDTGWTSDLFATGAGWWDGNTNTVTGVRSSAPALAKWFFFRGSGNGVGLDYVVSDICQRSGLTADDIDVTDLASQTVMGFILSRQSPARSFIEQLAGVYLFDGVESDYILKFMLRDGKSVAATITQEELATLDDSGEFFKETRTQEVELPLRLTLTYMDPDNDYQQQAHSAKRILNPVPTMSSRNELSQEVPLVMTADFAKQAAEKILFASWIERVSYSLMIPWKYLYLDPADVVQINLDSGTQFRTRLVQTDVGAGFSIDVAALSEDEAQYASSAEAYGGEGPLETEFLSAAITKLLLLACPLLRDSDDVSRTVSKLYYFMGGYGQRGWNSAILYKSSEGTEYTEVGASIAEMTWGTAANALGDTDAPFATDKTNTLTVYLNTNVEDGLASATALEVLNGANAAALVTQSGDVEVIQFQTATLNSNGSYTLSNLLRGRRGTEWATGLHSAGDIFLLLEQSTGSTLSLALGEVNADRFYKAATSGRYFEDAPVTELASPGNDLRPYAPVQLAKTSGSWGSDISLEWVRRTRIGGGLRDGGGSVPLAETSEAYEVDILFGNIVVRTIEDLTSPSAIYTAAQQASDFPGGFVDLTSTLLTNPSFEDGNLNAWSFSVDSVNAIRSGTDDNIAAPQDGLYWLSMEEYPAAEITASQNVDLSAWQAQIAQGVAQVRVGAYVASTLADLDYGKIVLTWFAADGTTFGTASSANVDPADDGSWTLVQVTDSIPVDAKTLQIALVGTKLNGSYTNVCWDNVTLELDEGTKKSLRFQVYQISAEVGRGFGSAIKTVEV